MGTDVDTIDRDATAFYYFQGNRDGTAKAKYEVRYDRDLWNDCAQIQIRIPFIGRYPTGPNQYSPVGNPYSGFGNLELRYFYNVVSPTFDHSLEGGIALPTASNGVESLDTQIKLFYTTKWKWNGGSVAYANEYDQSIIRPPGSSETSYYEGKLTLPNASIAKWLKVSAIYNYRVLFNQGGIVNSAAGATIFGSLNDLGLSIYDTWGVSTHALWKYKFEANLTARL